MSVYTSNGRRYSKRIRYRIDQKKINPNSYKLEECCEEGIYKVKEYGGRCSKCLKQSNPELFKKEITDKNIDLVDNPFYSIEILEEVTRLVALPIDHYLFKSLKFIFENGSIETKRNENNILKFYRKFKNQNIEDGLLNKLPNSQQYSDLNIVITHGQVWE